MLLIGIVKFAALDLYGLGIEMEGGRPSGCDALNGLPGLLGSSMAETYELARLFDYLEEVLSNYDNNLHLPIELDNLLTSLLESANSYLELYEDTSSISSKDRIKFWKERNCALELYREAVKYQLRGEEKEYTFSSMAEAIKVLHKVVDLACSYAWDIHKNNGSGVCPTYFYYTVTDYKKTEEGIEILDAILEKTPDFLEGNVRFFKTKVEASVKKNLYKVIKNSKLYDNKLKMYKVNADLENASYELGRAKSFTPGWLEINPSGCIWSINICWRY